MKVPEQFRVTKGILGTTEASGCNGAFMLPSGLRVIVGKGLGWEHVSVSWPDRCPTWAEMCEVKDLFWEPEDVVMQLHPARSDYVNCHPYCLHLWRPLDREIPLPPPFMVGPKTSVLLPYDGRCRKCGVALVPGRALRDILGGVPDFPGDAQAVTVSPTGAARMVDCLKCPGCGWSVTA